MLVNDVYAQVRDTYLEKTEAGGVGVGYIVSKVQGEWKNNYGHKTVPIKNTILSQMDVLLAGEKLIATKRRYGTPQVPGWKGWKEKG
jgi:hypothetical protein